MESILAKENEEIFKMKSDIISLKLEANEAIHIKEEIEKQLAKKNNDCEKLEEEIVSLRKKVEGMDKTLKISQALDDMLNHQRCPFVIQVDLQIQWHGKAQNQSAQNEVDLGPEHISHRPDSNGTNGTSI